MRALFPWLLSVVVMAAPLSAAPVAGGPLYDRPAPGSEQWTQPREAIDCNGEVSVYNTQQPKYEMFLPDRSVANGTAVILLPGGGLRVLGVGASSDREVDAFLKHGIAVLRLEYRTLQLTAQSIQRACRAPVSAASPPPPPTRFPKLEIRNGNANPSPNNAELHAVLDLAVADAQEAMRLMKRMAPQWHLDPARIGMIGTSAGGGVALGTIFADTPPDAKPAFFISIFGPSLQDVVVPSGPLPIYLVTEADHGPVTDGLLALFSIWKTAGQKAELHVYEVPNFSMSVDLWGPRLFDWMKERGLLSAGVRPASARKL